MSPQLFTPEDLIACYQQGVFPMAEARTDDRIFIIDPDKRGVQPLDGFHVPRRLARTVRAEPYQIRIDTAFDAVVEACAAPGPGRPETWINSAIQDLYRELFTRGAAHTVECWTEGALVGGLYGVSIGAAFFGESMFSARKDASKIALVHLAARLKTGGYHLLDMQFLTEHLAQFGAIDVTRPEYKRRLAGALAREGDFYRMPAYAGGQAVLQAISHTS